MKLVLNSKQDLKKFHEWLTDKIGELNTMELEDIAREAFMAGMRESQNVIDDLRNDLAEYVELHSKVASELNTANHKLMQIEDLAKRESGLTKRAADEAVCSAKYHEVIALRGAARCRNCGTPLHR